MIRSYVLVAVAAAFTMSACAIGPNYKRPDLPVPETFRGEAAETGSLADLPWWEVFGDETLTALIREALENNRDLAQAAARVEQARYIAAVARSPLFPQLGYEAAGARGEQTFLDAVSPGRRTDNSFLAVLTFAWEIDIWGRIRRSAEAARADLLATEAFRRGIVLSLVSAVAQSYFELRELDRELEIAHESVESFGGTFDLFGRQFLGGVTSKLDPLRADAARVEAAALVPDIERRIIIKENEISVLLGRPVGPIPRGAAITAEALPPEIPAGVPSQLLERRPDLIEAEQSLVAANARIGEALAEYFPRVGLTALYGGVSTDLSDLLDSSAGLWSAGGSLFGPIFTAGRTTYVWRAAGSASEAAEAAYEGALLNALREVSDALITREKLGEVRVAQERVTVALRESVDISTTRYLGGLARYLDVLDAQQQLYPAEFALARTQRDQLIATVAIYRSLGGGWSAYDSQPAVPLPIAP